MQPERWEPDPLMVAAVLSMPKASRKLTELSGPDRSWLVAGLTNAGMTADEIAERCGCSRRLVMAVRAEDMTQVCKIAQQQSDILSKQLSTERSGHSVTRRDLAEKTAESARLRLQLDQLVSAHQAGELKLFRCGHPRVRYNTYAHGGKSWCRECGRIRKAQRRKNRHAA